MHSDLDSAFAALRARIAVPDYPAVAIIRPISSSPTQPRRHWLAAIVVGISLIAAAAAANVMVQSKIHVTTGGGLVLSSSSKPVSRTITSSAQVEAAASQMNFPVTLPAGLPQGTKPISLYTSGRDLMVIRYDLPGTWRASHHSAWIFLANPQTLSGKLPETNYRLRTDRRMSQAHWNVRGETVIVVSNGFTPVEVDSIKSAMTH